MVRGGTVLRIGVFSDTHGILDNVPIALARMGKLDLLLHAGDCYGDLEQLKKMTNVPVEAVIGNCDMWCAGPREHIINLAGKKIFLVHGHQYNIKSGLHKLYSHAEEIGVDVVVYGHTHQAESLQYGSILMFNPGSISRPRNQDYPSYGLLEIVEGRLVNRIYYIEYGLG